MYFAIDFNREPEQPIRYGLRMDDPGTKVALPSSSFLKRDPPSLLFKGCGGGRFFSEDKAARA